MKNFILGFVTATILLAGVMFFLSKSFMDADGTVRILGVELFRLAPKTSSSNPQPVQPQDLSPGSTDFGTLRVEIFGLGNPLAEVEVDLAKTEPGKGPIGPMTYAKTDANGIAMFERVPVGSFSVFFNLKNFPKGYKYIPNVPVEIIKNQTIIKKIELIIN